MVNKVEIGNRMFTARMRKNIKQFEMGKILGIGQSSYSDIETGKREMNITQLFTIADTLDVSVQWILGLDNNNALTNDESIQVEEFKRFLINKRKSWNCPGWNHPGFFMSFFVFILCKWLIFTICYVIIKITMITEVLYAVWGKGYK